MRAIVLLMLAGLAATSASADDGPVTRSNAIAILGKARTAAGLPLFPLRQPERPEGRRGHAGVGRHLRQLQSIHPTRHLDARHGRPLGGPARRLRLRFDLGHLWESLLTPSADEAASGYGHIAETIELPANKLWVAFELRPEAKFSDGTPVTAEDVAWTYHTLLEQGRPGFRIEMADVKDVVVESPRRVVFHFKSNENRELPLILGGLPVLPKHFFDGRDFSKPLTDPPIGSGPYRISNFELGRSVTYERRPDWWAANLPTGKGTNNFNHVRIEYFRDSTVALEAFKAGQIDLRSENISKNWATAYDFPAVARGLVIKRDFHHHLPTGMQGFAMNTRRRCSTIRWCARQWPRRSTSSGRTRTSSTAAIRAR